MRKRARSRALRPRPVPGDPANPNVDPPKTNDCPAPRPMSDTKLPAQRSTSAAQYRRHDRRYKAPPRGVASEADSRQGVRTVRRAAARAHADPAPLDAGTMPTVFCSDHLGQEPQRQIYTAQRRRIEPSQDLLAVLNPFTGQAASQGAKAAGRRRHSVTTA